MSVEPFIPPWWLKNKHVQTCFTTMFPYRAKTPMRWEELTLPDGDFIDIVWAGAIENPVVILLHGLEGSVNSHGIQLMLDTLVDAGWQVVVMHYRTCSGRMNRKPQGYHGDETKDLEYLINVIRERFPRRKMCAVGFSLGGNMLMRICSQNPQLPFHKVAVISPPYEMTKSADYLLPFYQRMLLRSMKDRCYKKINLGHQYPLSKQDIKHIKTLREFDKKITVPLYGYASVEDYYDSVSCRSILKTIQHDTLVLHSLDDPFIPRDSVPRPEELSEAITYECTSRGGHVGFITGQVPWKPTYWLRKRILDFIGVNPT